ncbi:LamG domain-containing protein [Paenibacillus illinoisensis]|uniref:LamG domain-containing protein n=1 Tax=Paenibacillus illinoisensis TaxID=59845 RepID=UPI0030179E3C
MSQAHKGSRLLIKDAIYAVPFESTHFNFNEDVIGIRQGDLVEPLGNDIYSMREDEGRYGGAVLIEDGTTNLASNPFNGGIGRQGSGNITTITETEGQFAGWYKTTINIANTTSEYLAGIVLFRYYKESAISYYSVSMDFYSTNKSIVPVVSNTEIPEMNMVEVGANRWECNAIPIPAGTNSATLPIYLKNLGGAKDGDVIYFRNKQAEKNTVTTSYTPYGTTRGMGNISYPTEVFNPKSFTINMWVKWKKLDDSYNSLFECQDNPENRFLWMLAPMSSGKNLSFISASLVDYYSFSANNTTPVVGRWYMYTITYDGSKIIQYVDGAVVSTHNIKYPPDPLGANVYIGSGATRVGNALIDEVVILPNAVTSEEVSSWFIAGTPFYNPYDYRGYAY